MPTPRTEKLTYTSQTKKGMFLSNELDAHSKWDIAQEQAQKTRCTSQKTFSSMFYKRNVNVHKAWKKNLSHQSIRITKPLQTFSFHFAFPWARQNTNYSKLLSWFSTIFDSETEASRYPESTGNAASVAVCHQMWPWIPESNTLSTLNGNVSTSTTPHAERKIWYKSNKKDLAIAIA